MNANPGNHQDQLIEMAKAIAAILGVPLVLFTLVNSFRANLYVSLIVAFLTAILASAWMIRSNWVGITELAVGWLSLIVVVLAFLVIWPKTMTVEGKILDLEGQPVRNKLVVLFDRSNRRYEIRTDEQGLYKFDDVPTGKYRVQVDNNEVEGQTSGFLVRVVEQNITLPRAVVDVTPTRTPTTLVPTASITPSPIDRTATAIDTPPVSTPTPTPTPTSTLTPTPTSTLTPTPTATPPIASSTPYVTLGPSEDLIFGPYSGSLVHEVDGETEDRVADVNVRDFYVEAVFFNPYSTSEGNWDIGFLFRHAGPNNQFRLVIESSGTWTFENWTGDDPDETVTQGQISNLDVSADGSNQLGLIAEGNWGYFWVNGDFVARLDLASRTISGDIMVATELRIASESDTVEGTTTKYENFTIRSPLSVIRETDGAEMVYVPGGTFEMGSSEAETDAAFEQCEQDQGSGECLRNWFERESPPHTVTLDSFWIDKYEVTNAQYRKCVEDGDCLEPGCWGNSDFNAADQPAVCVNWIDAQGYCDWVGAQLPTEAEWEYAARGPQRNTYPWGDTFDGEQLNFCDDSCSEEHKNPEWNDGYELTAPVGSFEAGTSWLGALDMAGNVFEWVNDWYQEDYYAVSPQSNPPGPGTGDSKVLRGGSWNSRVYYVASASRRWYRPRENYSDLGFRCVAASTP